MLHRMVPTLRSAATAAASPFVKTALAKRTFVSPLQWHEQHRFIGPSRNERKEMSIKEFLRIRNQRPYPYVIDIRTDEQREEWGVLPEAVRMSRKSISSTTYCAF